MLPGVKTWELNLFLMTEEAKNQSFDRYYSALSALKDEPYDPLDFKRLEEVYKVIAPVFNALHGHELKPEEFVQMAHWYIEKPYDFDDKGELYMVKLAKQIDFLLHLTRLLKNVVNSEFAENALNSTAKHKYGSVEAIPTSETALLSKIAYHRTLKTHSMTYAKALIKSAIEKVQESSNLNEESHENPIDE